jgi:hypothetical protein
MSQGVPDVWWNAGSLVRFASSAIRKKVQSSRPLRPERSVKDCEKGRQAQECRITRLGGSASNSGTPFLWIVEISEMGCVSPGPSINVKRRPAGYAPIPCISLVATAIMILTQILPKERDAQQLLGILLHTTAMSGLPACEPNFFNCA